MVKVNLLVLKSRNPARIVRFYSLLGFDFNEEQHGTGPIHFAGTLDEFVLEVYPVKTDSEVTDLVFGLDVDSVLHIINNLSSNGMISIEPKRMDNITIVKDPDLRSIYLTEKQNICVN